LKIAIAGKGGVGKTTICSNLAKLYIKRGYNVYAVDASPDGGLWFTLGISRAQLETMKPIYDMREFIDDKAGDGALYLLNPDVEGAADRFSLSIHNIKFLRMSAIKTGGSTCYCRESSFLKTVINSLILNENDVVILDMSAGIEHLTRGTAQGVGLMLIVIEASGSSIDMARNIEKLSEQLGVKEVKFLGNKVKNEKEELFIKTNIPKEKLIGVIHYSEAISDKAMGLVKYSSELDSPDMETVLGKLAPSCK